MSKSSELQERRPPLNKMLLASSHAPTASPGEATRPGHAAARAAMRQWRESMYGNIYSTNEDLRHTVRMYLGDDFAVVDRELAEFGAIVPTQLEPLVAENDRREHFPRVEQYNGIGDRDDRIVHHPTYELAGDIIYGTGIVERLTRLGGLCEGMSFYLLASHAGEAGHNCPVICNYELARLLAKLPDFPLRKTYIDKLLTPSYRENFTASQFLTEVQGGSDVGTNATRASSDDPSDGAFAWSVTGEKWFCSNANAELHVMSARYDEAKPGTRGLGLFLVPARRPDGSRNSFSFRRLKDKVGTRALATAEIDFHGAYAISLGPVERGFKTLMEEVIHHSRIALAFTVCGNGMRAYQQARAYAETRVAFGKRIIDYPLVQENLAWIRATIAGSLAGVYALAHMQDEVDRQADTRLERKLFIRLMANVGKHLASRWMLQACHRALDTLAGNGTIESFSSIPRLLRDTLVEENWEGTHNTIRAQVLRDLPKFELERVYLTIVREELSRLQAGDEKTWLSGELLALEERFAHLRNLDSDLQSLEIQHVIDRMGSLFYYLKLVWEADDQAALDLPCTKRAQAALFRALHLEETRPAVNHDYLQLVATVVEVAGKPIVERDDNPHDSAGAGHAAPAPSLFATM